MKLVMQVYTNNNDEQGQHSPGEIVDIPDELATEWLNRGWALPHKEADVERAVGGAPEKATGKAQQPAGRAPIPEAAGTPKAEKP
jgi:hypothetical protein